MLVKNILKRLGVALGYEINKIPKARWSIKEEALYQPLFSPWLGYGEFGRYLEIARPYSGLNSARFYVLYSLARQAATVEGDWCEFGTWRGGSAMFLARLMDKLQNCKAKKLHLFDSFEGMPDTDASKDIHQSGNFSDTSLEAVRKRVESVISDKSMVEYHKGFIPASFQGVETGKLSFCHIDLDLHRAIADACEYAYPKLQTGGFILFDDYGFPSCPGAREAVDDFFADKPEVPLVLQTGQAIVFCGS